MAESQGSSKWLVLQTLPGSFALAHVLLAGTKAPGSQFGEGDIGVGNIWGSLTCLLPCLQVQKEPYPQRQCLCGMQNVALCEHLAPHLALQEGSSQNRTRDPEAQPPRDLCKSAFQSTRSP